MSVIEDGPTALVADEPDLRHARLDPSRNLDPWRGADNGGHRSLDRRLHADQALSGAAARSRVRASGFPTSHTKALTPVMSRPTMSVCIVSVPS
jgi:hypothetical protein